MAWRFAGTAPLRLSKSNNRMPPLAPTMPSNGGAPETSRVMRMVTVVALVTAGVLAAGVLLTLRPAAIAPEVIDREYGGPPSQWVKLPGGTIARYQDFPADKATTNDALLLLHGGAVSLETWAPWI